LLTQHSNKAIIVPGGSTDNVRDSIDALREQISELEQYGTKKPRSEAHQDLLTLAEHTVADGETVYEQSVTSGSHAPNSLYVTPQQQDLVAAWLHQQAISHQQPPSAITATTESVPSLNLNEDRINFGLTTPPNALLKGSDSRQETDLELSLACHKVKRLLSDADVQYNAGNYCKAKTGLQDMLPALRALPSEIQNEYDFFDIQYKLSIASYYASEHTNARKVLSEFVGQEASSADRKLNIAHASSLLACVYVETRELAAARSSCVKAIQMYRSILGDNPTSVEPNLALAARIELLSGNREAAAALLGQTNATHRNQLSNHYAKLPHKQGSSIVERKNIVACEDYLFANAGLSEETGRTEMVTLPVLAQSPLVKRSWMKRSRRTTVPAPHTFEPILTQLHIAALFGDIGWATALIADGADVNHACTISTSDCRQLRWKRYHDPLMPITPVACALLLRHMNMVCLLVSRGASLTTWGGSSYAVALLNEAYVADDAYSMEEALHCLKHLGWDIDSPIDVDCSRSRRTMLHHAASVLDTDNVRCLTSCGANVLVKDEADNIPLNLAMKATGSAVTKTMSLLLQHKPQEQLVSRDKDGRTPLHYLMSLDNHVSEDAAWILLRAGANPFLMDRFGNTPYQWFLRNRHHWTDIRAICEEYRSKTPRLDQSDSQPAYIGLQAHATEHLSTAVSDTDYAQPSAAHGLVRPTSI